MTTQHTRILSLVLWHTALTHDHSTYTHPQSRPLTHSTDPWPLNIHTSSVSPSDTQHWPMTTQHTRILSLVLWHTALTHDHSTYTHPQSRPLTHSTDPWPLNIHTSSVSSSDTQHWPMTTQHTHILSLVLWHTALTHDLSTYTHPQSRPLTHSTDPWPLNIHTSSVSSSDTQHWPMTTQHTHILSLVLWHTALTHDSSTYTHPQSRPLTHSTDPWPLNIHTSSVSSSDTQHWPMTTQHTHILSLILWHTALTHDHSTYTHPQSRPLTHSTDPWPLNIHTSSVSSSDTQHWPMTAQHTHILSLVLWHTALTHDHSTYTHPQSRPLTHSTDPWPLNIHASSVSSSDTQHRPMTTQHTRILSLVLWHTAPTHDHSTYTHPQSRPLTHSTDPWQLNIHASSVSSSDTQHWPMTSQHTRILSLVLWHTALTHDLSTYTHPQSRPLTHSTDPWPLNIHTSSVSSSDTQH